MISIEIFTDGSCNNKSDDKFGGWAYNMVISYSENIVENLTYYGCCMNATSSTMELKAVFEALKMLNNLGLEGSKINIHSDSQYVVGIFNEKWYEAWEIRNFIGVKNEELIKDILKFYRKITQGEKRNTLNFVKVKGHAGIVGNELVDKYAKTARETIKKAKTPIGEARWCVNHLNDTKLIEL